MSADERSDQSIIFYPVMARHIHSTLNSGAQRFQQAAPPCLAHLCMAHVELFYHDQTPCFGAGDDVVHSPRG